MNDDEDKLADLGYSERRQVQLDRFHLAEDHFNAWGEVERAAGRTNVNHLDYIKEQQPCGSCTHHKLDRVRSRRRCGLTGQDVPAQYTCIHWTPNFHVQDALGMIGNSVWDRLRRWWHTREEPHEW